MNKYRIVAAAIAFATSWCSVSALRAQQDDFPSAYDKCRVVTSGDLADKRAPTFAAHRAKSPETVENPKLDLKSNPTARMYRTLLRQEVTLNPNFAGHYRVAIWGCGSSCAMFAVVNLKTGRVITPEGFHNISTVYFDVDDEKLKFFGFRNNSKLLVILGDLDEDESREGAFYLVLEDEHLRLIHSTLVTKDCETVRGNQ